MATVYVHRYIDEEASTNVPRGTFVRTITISAEVMPPEFGAAPEAEVSASTIVSAGSNRPKRQ